MAFHHDKVVSIANKVVRVEIYIIVMANITFAILSCTLVHAGPMHFALNSKIMTHQTRSMHPCPLVIPVLRTAQILLVWFLVLS